MKTTSIMVVAVLVGLSTATGCSLEQMFPEQVAMGLARLSTRNLAAISWAIGNDSQCGFASDQVKNSVVSEGEPLSEGLVTYTVDRCTIDFGTLAPVMTDCNGVTVMASGKVTVSGTQTIRGVLVPELLQGLIANVVADAPPVIPIRSDAVEMKLDVTFDGYEARDTTGDNGLLVRRGRVQFMMRPHLAANASLGLCAVATNDVTLEEIVYTESEVEIDAGDFNISAEIPRSEFGLQVGRWQDRENTMWGAMTVWDSKVDLPTAEDRDGLDPGYQRADFERSMACTEDLKLPIKYECAGIQELLGGVVGSLLSP
ncbi:MAG: hypothetical protein JXR83_03320 [Deltaproteobacteria bacterium]|nr:hypothetical protein [Deltaproteobacteria bacterium]